MAGYHVLEHTADLAVAFEAASLEELMAVAGRALLELSAGKTWRDTGDPPQTILLEADDLPGLLVVWLSELLFWWDARHVGLRIASDDIQIRHPTITGEAFVLTARGQPQWPAPDGDESREIKAVTYHKLEVGPDPAGGFRARVVFDL